jgi:hypothetical protein
VLGYSASPSSWGVAPQLHAGSAERRANSHGMSLVATGSGSRSPETNAEGHARPAEDRLTPLDGFGQRDAQRTHPRSATCPRIHAARGRRRYRTSLLDRQPHRQASRNAPETGCLSSRPGLDQGAPGCDLHSWLLPYPCACGVRGCGYFAVLHGTPRSRQIFRARASRISVWRGTDDRRFRGGFAHQEWLPPSRICSQPCFRRCLSRSARFIPRRALRCSRALQLAQRPDD